MKCDLHWMKRLKSNIVTTVHASENATDKHSKKGHERHQREQAILTFQDKANAHIFQVLITITAR